MTERVNKSNTLGIKQIYTYFLLGIILIIK